MTDERKNEIWAMLTPDERNKIKAGYKAEIGARFYNEGYNSALENIFGSHNLTAQAEEATQESPSHGENEPKTSVSEREMTQKSPSEPKFNIGDKVIYRPVNVIGTITYSCKIAGGGFLYNIETSYTRYSNCFECDLAPYTEPKSENEQSKYAVGDKVFVKTSRNLCSKDFDIFRRNPSYVQGIKDGMVTVSVSMLHSTTIPIEDIVPWVDGNEEIISSNAKNCENLTENGISDSKFQPERAESVEKRRIEDGRIVIPIKAEYDDSVYAAYRLDLAKEIAVAFIMSPNQHDGIAPLTVRLTNEIVKRLKETEE